MSEKEQVRTVEEEKKVKEILSAGETPSDPPKRGRGRPRKYATKQEYRAAHAHRDKRALENGSQINDTLQKLRSAEAHLKRYTQVDYLSKETSREETVARINEDKSVVAKLIARALELAHLEPINMQDPEQVSKRIEEFFVTMANTDTKPTVAGLGVALNGMSRRALYGIVYRGEQTTVLPPETIRLIKSAYATMEELWEGYMQHGQINPVTGIFLGKNHYGYQDRSEVAVTHEKVETAPKLDTIAERYALPVESIEVINSEGSKVE